ncbi:ketoacyl-ACP synthase III [candidate division KSB1 bacterium]|nr:ketoacyl-ACP synthase III [candidate division KSB1 bacterium]
MIVGTGRAVPPKVLTNQDLEKIVDTTDEWIRERTGIQSRFIVEEGTANSDLCTEAALKALEEGQTDPRDVDLLLVGTVTGDAKFPATAVYVQDKLGAKKAVAFDISAACSAFVYGLALADSLIQTRGYKNALVIGAEILTSMTDWEDRATCVLFGDGAGAVLLKPANGPRGILGTYMMSDGSLADLLYSPGGGSRFPASHRTVDEGLHFLKMKGREVFKSAVQCMGDAAIKILEQTGITKDQVDLLITHQANIRIIRATAKRLGMPMEKVFVNIERYGNTSSASIPIALDEARKARRLKEGDLCLMVVFGGGFTWGSALVRM